MSDVMNGEYLPQGVAGSVWGDKKYTAKKV